MVVGLALIWIPLISIFGVILWLRTSTLSQIQAQKKLDQCLYQVFKNRCQNLTQLSSLNQKIQQLTKGVLAIKVAKAASTILPPAYAILESTEQTTRLSINALAKYQDAILNIETLQSAAFLQCGIPTQYQTLQLKRMATIESTAANTTAPLVWQSGIKESEISILSQNFKTQSFGHCYGSGKLIGEKYIISFQYAARNKTLVRPPQKY